MAARFALSLLLVAAVCAAPQPAPQFPFEVVSGTFKTPGGQAGSFGANQIFQADWKPAVGGSKDLTLAVNVPNSFSGEAKFPATALTTDGFAYCAALKAAAGPGCKVVAGGAVELEGVPTTSGPVTLIVRPITKVGAAAQPPAPVASGSAPAASAPAAQSSGADKDKDLKDVKDSGLDAEEKSTEAEIAKLEEQLTPEAKKKGRVHRLRHKLRAAMKEIRRLRKAPQSCPNCPKPPQPVKTMTAAELAARANLYLDVTPVNDLAEEDRKLRDMGLNDKLAVDPRTLHHGKWLNIQIAGEHKHFVKKHEKDCSEPLCPLGADATAQPAVAIP